MSKRLLLAALLLAVSVVQAADEFPAWAREAASASVPKFDGKVPAVVLLDEQRLALDETGKRVCTNRHVLRILNREGKRLAVAREYYLTGTGKVRDLRGWVLAANGDVRKLGKERVLDAALVDNDIYNEHRVRILTGESDADPGSVFAWESVSEDKSLFSQWEWAFQGRLPVILSRFTLTLPDGWKSEAVSFNNAPVQPSVSGTTSTWEARNLPFLEDEPASPGVSSLTPRLGLTFYPSGGAKNAGPSFSSWGDVARFQAELASTQDTPTEALSRKAKELAGTGSTELERLSPIARFVQGINYIAIQTSVGRGGGYRPHAAGDVFTKAYGDCKDKANLMHTMLKAIGVESYLVAVYSGDRTHARESWPSPWQFNHMIVAVRVSAATRAPAVLETSPLGRLLIFDPTDDVTPLGYLPVDEQDSNAMLIAQDKGGLVRLPLAASSVNQLQRQVRVTLDEKGGIRAVVDERRFGDKASIAHRRYIQHARPEYLKTVEQMVSRTVAGARVSKLEPSPGAKPGEFQVAIEFESPAYAQLMQGRLMMFRPTLLQSATYYDFSEAKRASPVVLDPESFSETVVAQLPAGFVLDELPDPVELKTPFGTYRSNCEVKDGVLTYTRSMEVRGMTVPAGSYGDLRKFFGSVYAAEQSPVVLAKK